MVSPAEPERREQDLPAGLLDELRADAHPSVRPREVARARRRMKVVRLDDTAVIDAITDGLLDVASW